MVKEKSHASFAEYVRSIRDQNVKAVVLKLKNDSAKQGIEWEHIRRLLVELHRKDPDTMAAVLSFLLGVESSEGQ